MSNIYKCTATQCIHNDQNKADGCNHDSIIPKEGLFCMSLANGKVDYLSNMRRNNNDRY